MWNIQRMPAAREATAQTDDAHSISSDVSRLVEKTAELKSLLATLRPEYEYTGPRVVGGIPASTAYTMLVPFVTPCEVSIALITNTDSTNAATLTLSTDPNLDITTANVATMTATLDGNQSFLVIASPLSQTTVAGAGKWYPIQAESAVYVRVNGAGTKSAYFVLQFRRRVNAAGVPNAGF